MRARVRAPVFRWIMDSAGWETDEFAEATRINSSLIRQWRRRESAIDLRHIDVMSKKVRRPLSAFLLPAPPPESPIAGFRLPGSSSRPPSKGLCAAIELAREIQHNVTCLLDSDPHAEHPVATGARADIHDDPEKVAAVESTSLGLSDGRMRAGARRLPAMCAGPIEDVYGRLKDAVESSGMFVAQAPFPIEDARGFAVAGGASPVILINTRDAIKSRMFTMFHEYAHVLLDGGSLCHPDPESLATSPHGSGEAVEKWCDEFAASILMPRSEFLEALRDARSSGTFDGVASSLSRRFRMTERAVLVRAVRLLDGSDRQRCLSHYRAIVPRPSAAGGGRSLPRELACLNRLGRKYVKMVVGMEEDGLITEPDMCMYLDLDARHFDKLREIV